MKESAAGTAQSRQRARRTYNSLSRWYDLVEGPFETKARVAAVRMLDVRRGERVLEIGPGTGACLPAFARSVGSAGRVLAVDIADRMLGAGRRRVARCGLSPRVTFVCADAVALPLPDGCCDAVFMSFVLELFDAPDIPRVLAECRRVLRDGGRICVVALCKTARPGPLTRLYDWAHRSFPAVVDCRPIYVRSAVSAAGLRTVRARRLSIWGLPVDLVLARR